jgi:hypothetical protein
MTSRIAALFQLAEASNLPSILEHGLMSTKRLLNLMHVLEADRTARLRAHRPGNVRLSETVLIRDEKPMPPSALAPALEGGLESADWYALLNSVVFFWIDLERMERQRRACGARAQVLLTFDASPLLDRFRGEALVSPLNSGNARRKPAPRGHATFLPYETWLEKGLADGAARSPSG